MHRISEPHSSFGASLLIHAGAWAFVLLTCGCGDSDRLGVPDAGVADSGELDAGMNMGMARSPAPPAFECPEGWSELGATDALPLRCEPWPLDTPPCSEATARFPGETACSSVGPQCPAGLFAEDIPGGETIFYVSSEASRGSGDGTIGRPFADLGEAFRAASGGEVFALSKGRHVIAGAFPENARLWGACAAESELISSVTDGADAVLTFLETSKSEVRNFTIFGPTGGIRVLDTAEVDVHNVIMRGTGLTAVRVNGAGSFTGTNIVVRDTLGVDGAFGRALQVEGGGSVDIENAAFERTLDIAVQVVDAGSAVTLTNALISEVLPPELDPVKLGRAIDIGPGASVELNRTLVQHATDAALFAAGAGTEVTVRQSVFRAIRSRVTDGAFGRGVSMQEGSTATIDQLWIHDTREIGIYAGGVGTTIVANDLIVSSTDARPDQTGGRGGQFRAGASVTLTRSVFDDNAEYGVFIAEEGTNVRLVDTGVANTRGDRPDRNGRGVEAVLGASLQLERVRVAHNRDVGLYLRDVTAQVTDLAVIDTEFQYETGWYGRGVVVSGDNGMLTGQRVDLRGNHELGIYVQDALVQLSQVEITETHVQPCNLDCRGITGGHGALVIGGRLELTDFTVANNDVVGVAIRDGGAFLLERGVIEENAIGISTGDELLDVERALTEVELRANGRDLDATALPLPDARDPGSIEL